MLQGASVLTRASGWYRLTWGRACAADLTRLMLKSTSVKLPSIVSVWQHWGKINIQRFTLKKTQEFPLLVMHPGVCRHLVYFSIQKSGPKQI